MCVTCVMCMLQLAILWCDMYIMMCLCCVLHCGTVWFVSWHVTYLLFSVRLYVQIHCIVIYVVMCVLYVLHCDELHCNVTYCDVVCAGGAVMQCVSPDVIRAWCVLCVVMCVRCVGAGRGVPGKRLSNSYRKELQLKASPSPSLSPPSLFRTLYSLTWVALVSCPVSRMERK